MSTCCVPFFLSSTTWQSIEFFMQHKEGSDYDTISMKESMTDQGMDYGPCKF